MQEANMMFVATLIIAISIVECNLHRRLALSGLMVFGTKPESLCMGVMAVACFLSIWVNNVAITAMMVPVVDRICDELFGDILREDSCTEIRKMPEAESESLIGNKSLNETTSMQTKRVRLCLFLSVMFGANIGATTTITSAASNLVFTSILDFLYPGARTPVDYVSWMMYALPITVISLSLSYLAVWAVFFCARPKLPTRAGNVIELQYRALGKMSFAESAVLSLFVVLVIFWLLRDPTFMRGWATFFEYRPKDSTVAVAVVLLLLVLPRVPTELGGPPILGWDAIQARLSWTVILLIGCNFALAEAAAQSGLSDWISSHLMVLSSLNPKIVAFIFSVFASFLSEVLANAGVVSVLVPIFAKFAESSGVNPLLYMITPTIASNFCFLLPVGTPANTIIYEHTRLEIKDLFVPGILVKLCTIIGFGFAIFFCSDPIFETGAFPAWAERLNKTAAI
ncbi:solute carrier family 13 member 5-like [Galendromus occidentalis]|uniref:Solute carrier family 13 member 5-like n=1 Tax=Galendromus occidentalis TaxID=34638 RepID=A0AAJ7PAX1_9ACAR|nr:solute carrier family 13 member 5-like [Galendromus occidentalis]